MIFKEIDEKEFTRFSKKHEQASFHQTKEWAKLKKKNNWDHYYVGLYDNKKIIAATLILSKKIKLINKNMFYAPRGFLIDYKNKLALKEFTNKLKEFSKKKNAIFIKIDPYVEYISHDNNGNVTDKINNKEIVSNLKELGYKHFGFNLMQETLQPRWMHIINTKNKTLDEVMKDMESKTRQIIRKNEKQAITTREIKKSELPLFKEIMEHTGERRDFIDRPLSYYEAMWDALWPNILKILVAEIDFNKWEDNTKEELNTIKKNLEDRIYKHDNNILKMNEKKYIQANKQDEDSINRLNKQIDKIKEYKNKYKKDIIPLGTILFLIYGNEVLSLFGGTDDNLMQFQSAYTIHFEGIKLAVEKKLDRYNFYGITGIFDENNPLYGLFQFKKSFGGEVVELIGEFDLIISKFFYYLYKITFKLYKFIKRIKTKIIHK